MNIRETIHFLADSTAPTAGAGAGGNIPAITPNFNAPGVAGMVSLGGTIAAWTLVSASICIVLGALLAVFGPRLGFQGAKAIGMGGIIGGLAVGAVVAMATPGVDTVRHWFSVS